MVEQVHNVCCFRCESWDKDYEAFVQVGMKRGCNVERASYKDGNGVKNELERDEALLFDGNDCRKCVESHGVDMPHKDTCRVDDTEMLRCMEEYGVVAKYKGNACEG